MYEDEKKSEGMRKFVLSEETISAIGNDLRNAGFDSAKVFIEAAFVLIPEINGKVTLGVDGRAESIAFDDLPPVKLRALTPLAYTIGDGSRIMCISVGGHLLAISLDTLGE